MNHAIDNFLKVSNNSKIKFSLLWANHTEVPRNLKEFDEMVAYWLKHYLAHPQYYRIDGRPVVFVFLFKQLEVDAKKFGWPVDALFKRADKMAHSVGLPSIYFVANTNARPSDELENQLLGHGFSSHSG
ncbi:MAG: hypothetical protein PHV80_01635 [Rugosibacter sp.]|nr:hypothetical protein [Rugosibacter sp.]